MRVTDVDLISLMLMFSMILADFLLPGSGAAILIWIRIREAKMDPSHWSEDRSTASNENARSMKLSYSCVYIIKIIDIFAPPPFFKNHVFPQSTGGGAKWKIYTPACFFSLSICIKLLNLFMNTYIYEWRSVLKRHLVNNVVKCKSLRWIRVMMQDCYSCFCRVKSCPHKNMINISQFSTHEGQFFTWPNEENKFYIMSRDSLN